MSELCQRCNEDGEDRRTLWMACYYEMNELGLPFKLQEIPNSYPVHKQYTLRVCKDCRSDWMSAIKDWWRHIPNRESCGSGIFIREYGANVEITEEEFNRLYPGIEPTRVIPPLPESE